MHNITTTTKIITTTTFKKKCNSKFSLFAKKSKILNNLKINYIYFVYNTEFLRKNKAFNEAILKTNNNKTLDLGENKT